MRDDLYQELYHVEDGHWWHQHKRALVQQLVRKFTRKGRVLDVGAGTGKILSELESQGWQVIGVDGEKQAQIWSHKRGVKVKLVDLEKARLPFSGDTFDLVLALDVLEHLKNDKKLIKEAKRVLKPGGILVVTVPAYPKLFSYWDEMLGHQRRYTVKTVKRVTISKGFSLCYLSYFSSLVLFPALVVRLIKQTLPIKEKPISDFQTLPLQPIVEPFLRLYTFFERFLLRWMRLPFGLSIIAVVQKLRDED